VLTEGIDAYNQSKLNQKDIIQLNSPITCNEIETVIKSFPTEMTPGPERFKAEFYQTFKEELTPMLLKFFQEIEREETLPSSFYEASIILIQKPNKEVNRKGNYRTISSMNIGAKILNRILANRI
jgi:hypothetical protein